MASCLSKSIFLLQNLVRSQDRLRLLRSISDVRGNWANVYHIYNQIHLASELVNGSSCKKAKIKYPF